jgi:hypothetical protein
MVDATTKAEIEAVVVRFGKAFADGDVAALDTMLSPTFTHIDFRGRLTNRSAWLAAILPVVRKKRLIIQCWRTVSAIQTHRGDVTLCSS